MQKLHSRTADKFLPSATKLRRLCFYRCVSVHGRGGGGVCLSACWDTTPQEQTLPLEQTPLWEQTPPRADTPWSRHSMRADTQTPLEQTPPGTDTSPWSRHPPEQTPPTPQSRHAPRSRHPPQSRHPPRTDPPPRYGHCCAQYASYWNAFLFKLINLMYSIIWGFKDLPY